MSVGKLLVGGVAVVAVGTVVVGAAAIGAVWLVGTCMRAWSDALFGRDDAGNA